MGRIHIFVSEIATKKRIILILSTLTFLILVGVIGIDVMSTEPFIQEDAALCLLSWLGVLLFIWSLITWHAVRKEFICPYVLFLCCNYFFMYGQSFLWAFGIEGVPDLRDSFPSYQIIRAQVFTVLSLGFFHIGALYVAAKRSDKIEPDIQYDNYANKVKILLKSTQLVGWILFVVSIIPFASILAGQLKMSLSYGYGVLYDPALIRVGFGAIRNNLSQFFIPSLICLFIGYMKKPVFLSFILIFMLMRMVIAFYVGGRSPAMVMLLCMICMWHYFIGKIDFKKALVLILAAYLLISTLPIIGSYRAMPNRGFEDLVSAFTFGIGKSENFIKAISEIGGSMFPLIQAMNLMPVEYSFRYGESYFYSFFSLVPNLGLWQAHPAFQNANLGDWLQKILSLRYGPGFSPAAEAYYNFGWMGIIVMFVLGVFYGWVFTLISRNNAWREPAISSFVFIIFSFTAMTSRNSFIGTVRAIFYYAVPIYIAIILVARVFKRPKADYVLR